MKKKRKIFKFPRPYVFVPLSADIFHHGHINVLVKAKKFGNTIVGLMTDKGIKSYKKKYPLINYNNRKKILEHLDCVDCILPLNGLLYEKYAKKFKFDFFVHGTDWKKGTQSKERKKLIKVMKLWKGKVIEPRYTPMISSTKIKKNLKNRKFNHD